MSSLCVYEILHLYGVSCGRAVVGKVQHRSAHTQETRREAKLQ